MTSRSDLSFSNQKINGFKTTIIGKNIFHFKTIDSTNLYAKKLVKEGNPDGTVVIADTQKKGRGRKQRHWYSPPGGLWFSVILYPNIHTEQAMLITMTAAISTAQAIKKVTELDPEIKWPNDILIKGKKLCGILTELESEKDLIKFSVIGIGINVNNEINKELQDIAISIKELKGIKISNMNLFKEIMQKFDYYYKQLTEKKYKNIRKIWFSFSKIIGKKVEVQQDGNIIIGEVCDIDKNGHLILRQAKEEVRITSGDLKYL
jgi:BirA family biotin operon repressor/biotin-[acetyl-CoA-carboxylase] ligase